MAKPRPQEPLIDGNNVIITNDGRGSRSVTNEGSTLGLGPSFLLHEATAGILLPWPGAHLEFQRTEILKQRVEEVEESYICSLIELFFEDGEKKKS